MEEQYTRTGSISKLAVSLIKFQASMADNKITKASKGYNYNYADLNTVLNAIRKPLSEAGLCVIQTTSNTENGTPIVKTMLLHESGEYIEGSLAIKPIKNDPQSVGSSLSYSRRYALLGILNLAAEDNDGAPARPRTGIAAKPAKPARTRQTKIGLQ